MIALNTHLPVPTSTSDLSAASDDTVRNLLNLWMSQLAESSRDTYRNALVNFQDFLRADTVIDAVGRLITAGKASATAVIMAFQSDLSERRGLAPASVNVRVAALRSLLRQALDLDMIAWTIRVKNLESRAYRDTRGPGVDNVRGMLDQVSTRNDAKGARDVAIVRLLYDCGLRRREVVGLDIEHFAGDRLWILGKGKREREPVTLPQQTRDALAAWIEYRGDHAGPLFVGLSNHGRGGRITGQSIYQIVQRLGRMIDIKTSPHRIRHSAITTAAGEEGLIGAQRFARHADPGVTTVYLDNLEDVAGRVARKVAATV